MKKTSIGIRFPQILLPIDGIELTKWATIACDQFTSEPEYWDQVERIVGNAPSTLRLVLPEIYLGTPEEELKTQQTWDTMREYLAQGIFRPVDGPIYVERTVSGRTRSGLMLELDLENYDFTAGSQSLIRATEGTIVDRLPPRIRIREGAELELPHILVLIDDPEDELFSSIRRVKSQLPNLYNFELLLGSGHLAGWQVNATALKKSILNRLESMASLEAFSARYGVARDKQPLLIAMGDGNHSLATAKSVWESLKGSVNADHPARFALVELENIHDPSLGFEPIHRVLFGVDTPIELALRSHFGDRISFTKMSSFAEMDAQVRSPSPGSQAFGIVTADCYTVAAISDPRYSIAIASLQPFLDEWLKTRSGAKLDYIHGASTVEKLGSQSGNVGFYLPPIQKTGFFKTIIQDGAFPRKSFSIGEAHEKRFYFEARRIKPPDK